MIRRLDRGQKDWFEGLVQRRQWSKGLDLVRRIGLRDWFKEDNGQKGWIWSEGLV